MEEAEEEDKSGIEVVDVAILLVVEVVAEDVALGQGTEQVHEIQVVRPLRQ